MSRFGSRSESTLRRVIFVLLLAGLAWLASASSALGSPPSGLSVHVNATKNDIFVAGGGPNDVLDFTIESEGGAQLFRQAFSAEALPGASLPGLGLGNDALAASAHGVNLSPGTVVRVSTSSDEASVVVSDIRVTNVNVAADSFTVSGTPNSTANTAINTPGAGVIVLTGLGSIGPGGATTHSVSGLWDIQGGSTVIVHTPSSFSFAGVSSTIATGGKDYPGVSPPLADNPLPTPHPLDRTIAERFSPILYFHPDECFFPMDVDSYLDDASLVDRNALSPDTPVAGWDHTGEFLRDHGESDHYLDLPTDSGEDQYCSDYEEIGNAPPAVLYAIVREEGGRLIVQYWMFYYYDSRVGADHEADWELVQMVFQSGVTRQSAASSAKPAWVAFSQHGSSQRRSYTGVNATGLHPWVSVALGSHANSYSEVSCLVPGGLDERKAFNAVEPMQTSIRLLAEEPWPSFPGKWGQENLNAVLSPANEDRGEWRDPVDWMGTNSTHCPNGVAQTSVIAQSPVELHAYDELDRHVGPNLTGGIDLGIPGATYTAPNDSSAKAISLPSGGQYRVEVVGTGDGQLTLTTLVPQDDGVIQTSVYADVPVTMGMLGEVEIGSDDPGDLLVDADGVGGFETSLHPDNPDLPLGLQGDANCDGLSNSIDALDILKYVASIEGFGDCVEVGGDVDCSGDRDALDALLVLRSVAALDVALPEGCTAIGSELGVG